MRHSRSEKALALTVLRRESRFRRRTALRGLLEAACREVRDLARFPQSSRAVTQKRIGASTGLRVAAPSTQMPLGLMFAALAVVSCGSAPKSDRVQATYDKQTGKLVQLTGDAKKDGKP